ncbi:hypothetical protein PoB_002087700 [Plakobranchus ocellatus]|uniref:Ig-like domain-containing protein n=1 Tax=Plakobranchus ocellatus TaxID=259542 RepID=A0AAV3ZIK7_9GAST|nr:hypothetical protein PoB_002087700 [Plakobranchus ocellatus]
MELEKQFSKSLFFICLVASVSGHITMSNPSSLASVTEITPGMPFAINCNADAIGLFGQRDDMIMRLQIHRMLQGETQESLIVDFNLYYDEMAEQRKTNIPPGRSWVVSFPDVPSSILGHRNNMKLKLEINDALYSDAGIYQCTVTYEAYANSVDAVGQQILTAKAAVPRNLFISPTPRFSDSHRLSKMYNIALTCGADGGPNLEMSWLRSVPSSGDFLSHPNPEDIVDEDPSPIPYDESSLMRYRSTLTVQVYSSIFFSLTVTF